MVQADGCAWHQEQTHVTLTKYLIEEAYEAAEAIDRGDPADSVREELGDVLYQVLFHTAIAERDAEGYDFDSTAEALADKLIARHPHVFGDRGYLSVEELNAEWEHLKEDAAEQRRGTRGPLDGVPANMPPLERAAKVVERLRRAGLAARPATPAPTSPEAVPLTEEELGDALLALVINANAHDIDPGRALRAATARYAESRVGSAVEE